MKPAMTPKEIALYISFLRNSDNYIEFGTGGSTCLAADFAGRSVLSVDSSKEWQDRVAARCAGKKIRPRLVHADIGPLGKWGRPSGETSRGLWPSYHEAIWADEEACNGDLYFIDGRFRVACFVQAVLHAGPGAVIGFHDFSSRTQYHCVREVARQIATADEIAFFVPLPGVRQTALRILESHRLDHD